MKRTLLSTALFLALSIASRAASFGPGSLLVPIDLAGGSIFGQNVAASGNTLAAGAPLAGAVYVFQRSGDDWIFQAKLTVNDGTFGFGSTLALDGNTLVADGHVFVNNNGTWTLQAVLPRGAVAISQDTLAIATATAANVFVRNNGTWTQQASMPLAGGSLIFVALQSDTMVIGAPNTAFSSGAAFVYHRQNGVWAQQAKLVASDPAPAALFGIGLCISGDTIGIGAPGEGVFEDQPGSAYMFVNNNGVWTQQAKLQGNGTQAGAEFGTSLALVGNTLLVGAYDDPLNGMGTAHIFLRNGSTWTDQYLLAPGINGIPGPGSPDQRFANAVAMDGSNTFIMGSPTYSIPGNSSSFHVGAIYRVTLH